MQDYGSIWADVYDSLWQERDDPEEVTAALERLAAQGPALELGVGTGRLAIPLAERGVPVLGIDISPQMLAKLRAKPGGERVETLQADISDFRIDGHFSLIYNAFSTLYMLTDQELQIRSFQAAARHLAEGGVFVVEGFVHDRARFVNHQYLSVPRMDAECVDLHVSLHDPVTQTIRIQHVFMRQSGLTLRPVKIRYVWPSEMDLMARLAGLKLEQRWSSWSGAPFTASSGAQIALYRKT